MYKKLNFKLYIILLSFNFLEISASQEIRKPLIHDNTVQMSEAYVEAKLQAITDLNMRAAAYHKEVILLATGRLDCILSKKYKTEKDKNGEYIDVVKSITTMLNSVLKPDDTYDKSIEHKNNSIRQQFNNRKWCIKIPPYLNNKDQLTTDGTELHSLLTQRFEVEKRSELSVTNPSAGWKTYNGDSD